MGGMLEGICLISSFKRCKCVSKYFVVFLVLAFFLETGVSNTLPPGKVRILRGHRVMYGDSARVYKQRSILESGSIEDELSVAEARFQVCSSTQRWEWGL